MNTKAALTPLLILLFALLLSGCALLDSIAPQATAVPAAATAVPATAPPTVAADPTPGMATVDSLEIMILESFPVQVHVGVTGSLPNDCTEIDEISAEREGNTFTLAMSTQQDSGAACGGAAVPFDQIVPLDVNGLPAGSYTVTFNDVSGSFNLDIDNVAQEAPEEDAAEATTEAEAIAFSASGRVWHDICAGDAADAEADPPAGCRASADGFIGDGLQRDEPGIAGIRVNLAQGACPSTTGILTATTDEDGVFSFGNLKAAEYCIFVDTADEVNQDALLPGIWTAPAGGTAEATLVLSAEEAAQEVNFGWDYELLPVDLADCSNSFELLEDLNIPDDTVVAPGEEFTKRWRLRNNGSCPWSTDFTVIFVGGDQMEAEESIPLTAAVAASQTLDVAVDMVAPDEEGTYRGNWQIADADGEPFGIDGNIEDAFWLRIVVEEESVPSATPEPGSAAIGGVVWDDYCINSSPARGCVESGENSGVFIADGTFDGLESGLSEITISLAEGACPGDGTLPAASALIDTAVTADDGIYLFDGLETGTYCIFMDALSEDNVDQLIPGNWTWPATGVGRYTFILDPGEQALDLDFGWDYVD